MSQHISSIGYQHIGSSLMHMCHSGIHCKPQAFRLTLLVASLYMIARYAVEGVDKLGLSSKDGTGPSFSQQSSKPKTALSAGANVQSCYHYQCNCDGCRETWAKCQGSGRGAAQWSISETASSVGASVHGCYHY